ncbi:CheR family methyltransferase [Nitrincola tapanii]|uniref:Chemotaxis protein methyltransferase n=1 Tax=Nitrincola tapanii TaxID=1708751 RepID=A0A5A9W4M2_9GAMM|nr:CheR family methyltransferase [Nitrincola tapanii]KAA0875667.1 chemotaxis protein CheR [Nitrincola tapanii]
MQREFDFTDADFERIRALIRKRAGISLTARKRDLVYSRIARRLRVLGLSRFSDYLDYLQNHNLEAQDFINALTTNLTAFFREEHHFVHLAQRFEALQASQAQDKGRIQIWSAACSTGEEAYSLAMTAVESFGSWTPPVSILATDVDTNVLEHAKRGVYGMERIERLDEARVKTFFLKGRGARAGSVKVRPELQALISFRSLNLLAPQWPMRGGFEAIFCRNVMIYFDKPTQYQILSKLHPQLNERGLLYAGHSESFNHATDLFRSIGKTMFAPVRGTAKEN